MITTEERFLSKFRMPMFEDGCWLWEGHISRPHGYAGFGLDGKMVRAHRWSYGYFIGPIPTGLELDHLCRVRHCVNPQHLEPVTSKENNIRGQSFAAANARKTHCPMGHELPAYDPGAIGRRRECRACNRAACVRYRARQATVRALATPTPEKPR